MIILISMPIHIKCLVCSKIVLKPPSERKRKYCSSKCYGISQRGRSTCSISGCDGQVAGRGFCIRHYLRLRRTGNPIGSIPRKTKRFHRHHDTWKHSCLNCGITFLDRRKVARYCSRKCCANHQKKPFIIKKGYKKILIPSHPRADGKGYVFEHIIVLEAKLGRSLLPNEVSHHKDDNKKNNRPENLIAFKNQSAHIKSFHGSSK